MIMRNLCILVSESLDALACSRWKIHLEVIAKPSIRHKSSCNAVQIEHIKQPADTGLSINYIYDNHYL